MSSLNFIEPTDPLYITLGSRFIELQSKLLGTDHLYAVDQFNENDPRSPSESYLNEAGLTQFESLRKGDPEAIWYMQGWLFVFHANFWKPDQVLSICFKGKMIARFFISVLCNT